MKKKYFAFIAMVLANAAFAIPDMTLSVSPSGMEWSDQGFVNVTASNLTAGAEVNLSEFIDLNGNGVIDATDPLAIQFELEDGVATAFGAETFMDDNDGATNGVIESAVSFFGDHYLHSIGDYILLAVELDGSGAPVASNSTPFSVTQSSAPIWITGEVRDYVTSNTVAGAYVELQYFSDTTGNAPGTWTDENGEFSIYLPSGVSSNEALGVYAAGAGYMSASQTPEGDFVSLAIFTNGLASGANNLVRPLFVVPSVPSYDLVDITGTAYLIEPADGGGDETNVLAGAIVEIAYPSYGDEDDDGDISSFDISDADGNFSLVFSTAEDEGDNVVISCANPFLTMRGLVPAVESLLIEGTTNIALYCHSAEALVQGTVTNLDTGSPIVGVEVDLTSGNDVIGMAYTISNGTYEIGASAGTYDLQCNDDSLAKQLYVYGNEHGYRYLENIFSGEVRTDQDLAYEKGAPVSGHVYTEGGSPLGGGNAILVAPGEGSWEERWNSAKVAFDGHYDLLAPAGTWNVRTENPQGTWIDLYYTNCPVQNRSMATPVVVSNAPVSGIDFYLEEGARLQGAVLSTDSFPAGDTRMSVLRMNGSGELETVGSGYTDWDGIFDFVVPGGSNFYLRADSDGWQTPDTWLGNVGSYNLATRIHPAVGTTQTNLDIQILAGYQVAVSVWDQMDMTALPDISIAAFDSSSNQYGTAVYQWDAWNIFVPTNTPLTFFAEAPGYEGEFITNTYDFAEADYFQQEQNTYLHLDFVLHSSSRDTDGDGLADYLEDTVPDNEFWPEDYSDMRDSNTDGDQFNDNEEYITGTNPRDANSFFKIDGTTAGSGFELRWDSVAGREYTVQLSSDLTSGTWSNIHSVVATGADTSYAPPTTDAHSSYRVQVAAP